MITYLRILDYVTYFVHLINGRRGVLERMIAATRQRDIEPYLRQSQPVRVLDLANGRLRPQYTLLNEIGMRVIGIDLVNQPQATWTGICYEVARRLFMMRLGIHADAANAGTLTCGNANRLPFCDESFDLVTSVAAFEHFLDVPTVISELERVVRPGGLIWIWIHLFTSPSGGHNLRLTEIPLRKIPSGVDPWDHLRQRRIPFHVPLNKWRKMEFLQAFANSFEVISHYCAIREGEQWLTPALESELSDYSRDELTCGAYVVVGRKR